MARPRKGDSEKLSATLPPARCTEIEKEIVCSKACKAEMSLSEYIRCMTLKGEIKIRQSQSDFETVQQLRKIGINLNQETKKLHVTGFASKELKALWQKLDLLLSNMMDNQ